MNDISEQVNTLRELAEMQDAPYKKRIIERAIKTIEKLSQALQSVSMEQKVIGDDYKKQMMERFLKVN